MVGTFSHPGCGMRLALKKFRTIALCACLMLAALLLYSDHLRQRPATSLFHRVILQLTSPVQGGVRTLVHSTADLWQHYLWLVDTATENEILRRDNRRLQASLREFDEIRFENQRLKKLLDFREASSLKALPARVVAEDASSWFRTILIDKGSNDGVASGMPVVTAEGIVGRTFQISDHESRVLLVTDASSSIATTLQQSRSRGIARGHGSGLQLNYVERNTEVSVGELVITSGTGGVFPKGLAVGTVDQVEREEFGLFQRISMRPTVDLTRIEEILVLLRSEP